MGFRIRPQEAGLDELTNFQFIFYYQGEDVYIMIEYDEPIIYLIEDSEEEEEVSSTRRTPGF